LHSMFYDTSGQNVRSVLDGATSGGDNMVGAVNSQSSGYYVVDILGTWYIMSVSRTTGWHELVVRVDASQSHFLVDGTEDSHHGAQVTIITINLGSFWSANGYNSYFDACFVRKWVSPEPAHSTWGSEESGGAILKEVTDSLSLSDALLANKTFTVVDSVGLVDSSLKHWTPQIFDSLGLSDTILRDKQFSVSDSISLGELITVMTEIVKQVTDSLSLSEAVSLNKALLLADQIQLTDNVYVNKILTVSDDVALAEVVEKSVQGVVKTKVFLIIGDLAIQLTG
jgi:hypothetical protein